MLQPRREQHNYTVISARGVNRGGVDSRRVHKARVRTDTPDVGRNAIEGRDLNDNGTTESPEADGTPNFAVFESHNVVCRHSTAIQESAACLQHGCSHEFSLPRPDKTAFVEEAALSNVLERSTLWEDKVLDDGIVDASGSEERDALGNSMLPFGNEAAQARPQRFGVFPQVAEVMELWL